MGDDNKSAGNAPPKGDDNKSAGNAPPAPPSPPAEPINAAQRADLLKRARLAGVSTKSLAQLVEAIDSATVAELPNFEKQIEGVRAKNRETFHVVSAGSLRYEGDAYANGDSIELTPAEAEELGAEVVARGKAPPKAIEIADRKAGKYKVAGPGSVFMGGRFHEAGTLLELNQSDARSLAEYVVEA
jgi:hypothetical protein